jgi:serine phosphatase RsbU (regulator of sigma subunit)
LPLINSDSENIVEKLDFLLRESKNSPEYLTELFYGFAHAVADHIQLVQVYLPKIKTLCDKWGPTYAMARGIAFLSEALGNYYETKFDKVYGPAIKAIDILTEFKNYDLIGSAHMISGVNFRSLGEIDKAVKHLLIAADQIDPKGPMAVYSCYCYYQLGEINVYIKDFDTAGKQYLQAVHIAEHSGQLVPLFRSYIGMASYYLALNNLDLSLEYLHKTLNLKNLTASQISRATCDMGLYFITTGNYAEAIKWFKESYEMRTKNDLEDAASTSLIGLSEAYMKLGMNELALENLQSALEITEKYKSQNKRASCLKLLWEVNANLKRWEKAHQYAWEYETIQTDIGAKKLHNIYKLKNGKIEEQRYLLEEKNKEITDSINYAKRIQEAILPSSKYVQECLPDGFIFYKPKDIVAGDFYWMEKKDGSMLFAAADCTGHGVPGAMVSVLCNNALNRSVREFGLTDPGAVLDKTRTLVIREFEKSDEDMKDGMDIALCSIKGLDLSYAGANNPLWIVRNAKIFETKADKQPIGKHDKSKPYTTHYIRLEKGDCIYIFSDGYVDQFGGEKGKKFMAKNLKKLLLGIQDKSMIEQKTIIDDAFEVWRGKEAQVDDVCVIGLKV